MIERDGRGGVAGDDREARAKAFDQARKQFRHALRDFRLAALAVGKAGAVGGVDDRRVGQQRTRRREHRQAADAGIEEQEGGGGGHNFVIARSFATKQSICAGWIASLRWQ
jgi:hypothetical protein